MRFGKKTPTSTGIVIGHGPLDREQTEQEGNSGRPSSGAVDDTLTPKHVVGGVHFIARGGREEDYGDDCRKVSGVKHDCNYGKPTAGCSQVDENKTTG